MSRHVENERAPWAQVPEALIYDHDLSDKAVRIYASLRRHGDDPVNCYPSKARIAALIGCAPASVSRPLKELIDAGWVDVFPRFKSDGSQDSNGYRTRLTARTSSAPPAQESDGPPRSAAKGPRAQERAKREPLNESHGTREVPAADAAEAPELVLVQETTTAKERAATARSVTRQVWDARRAAGTPVPGSWDGAVGVVKALLAAGHEASAIAAAATAAPCVTIAAVELQLNGRRHQPGGNGTVTRSMSNIDAVLGPRRREVAR